MGRVSGPGADVSRLAGCSSNPATGIMVGGGGGIY